MPGEFFQEFLENPIAYTHFFHQLFQTRPWRNMQEVGGEV